MRKVIQIALLSLALLAATPSYVEGAILRANQEEQQGDERQTQLNNVSVERELQRRRGGNRGRNRGGKGGKGKGGMSSKGRGGRPIRFLPDRIEPIPFVNCIPLPPGFSFDDGKMGKAKSRSGGGGKGKGNRRNRRDNSRRELNSSKGRIRTGRNRGGDRNGARRNGMTPPAKKGMQMMMARLPFCPQSAPTFFPTALPSFTPIPTATPLPSITPFPSFTPLPTDDGEQGPSVAPGPTVEPGPTTPPAPTPVPAPSAAAPVATPPGTARVLIESELGYRLFEGITPREPTQEELDGLEVETSRFYTDLLSGAYPNLDSFEAVFVDSAFTAGDEFPYQIDFDANAFFTEGTTVPTAAEIFNVLSTADYQNYITNYVWEGEPMDTTVFFDVQEVTYDARVLPEGARK